MKTTTRILLAAALVLFGTAALPFADGFEAQASTCWSDVKTVDAANDSAAPILVQPGSLVCLDAGVAQFNCVPDALGLCKREEPPVPPQPVCTPPLPATTVTEKSWLQMVGADYPNSPSWLQPIGSWTMRTSYDKGGLPMLNRVLVAKFTADATAFHSLKWLKAQPVPAAGYGAPQGALTVTVAVTPCRGEPAPKCVATAQNGSLFYGAGAQSNPACKVTPGQTYWLQVTEVCDARNASGGRLCDANFRAQ